MALRALGSVVSTESSQIDMIGRLAYCGSSAYGCSSNEIDIAFTGKLATAALACRLTSVLVRCDDSFIYFMVCYASLRRCS